MSITVKVEGFRELGTALKQLPNATSKNVMRRVLREAGEPIAEAARGLAPVDEGHLRDSIGVSTVLSGRQRKLRRKTRNKDDVEMFVGAGPLPQAHLQEFGTENHPPHPFMRPAWDQHKNEALDIIKASLGDEIDKAVARLAKKAAKAKR